MKNAIKATLLSGLVFPGLGHLVLGKTGRGIAIIIATLAGLAAFVAKASQLAMAVVAKIQAEGGALDAETVSMAAARSVDASASLSLQLFLMIVLGCWLYGVIDAFFLGRKRDLGSRGDSPDSSADGQ